MDGQDSFNTLEFKNDFLFDKEIDHEPAIKEFPLVTDCQGQLPLESESSLAQLFTKAFFIGSLKETWAKSSMNFYCR